MGTYRTANGTVKGLAVHWDGTKWTRVLTPNPTGDTNLDLTGVTASSAHEAWAVGTRWDGATTTGVIEYWDGTSWSNVASANPGLATHLNAISAASPNDAWAVGYYRMGSPIVGVQTNDTLIEHWDGTTWTQVPSVNPGAPATSCSGYRPRHRPAPWPSACIRRRTTTIRSRNA